MKDKYVLDGWYFLGWRILGTYPNKKLAIDAGRRIMRKNAAARCRVVHFKWNKLQKYFTELKPFNVK